MSTHRLNIKCIYILISLGLIDAHGKYQKLVQFLSYSCVCVCGIKVKAYFYVIWSKLRVIVLPRSHPDQLNVAYFSRRCLHLRHAIWCTFSIASHRAFLLFTPWQMLKLSFPPIKCYFSDSNWHISIPIYFISLSSAVYLFGWIFSTCRDHICAFTHRTRNMRYRC